MDIFSAQGFNNFEGIFGHTVVKGFLPILEFGCISFASPDAHLPKLNFIFPFNHGVMGAVPMQLLVILKTIQNIYLQ